MKQLLIWILSAIVFATIGGLCVYSFMAAGETEEHEPASTTGPAETAETEPAISHDQEGNVVINFDRQTQVRVGVEVQVLPAVSYQPEYVAYGVLQEDPSRSFTLRSPLPGTLLLPAAGKWPKLGDTLTDNTIVGFIEPRLSPLEKADLTTRLAVARAEVEEARASLDALQASYESKRKLNAEQKIVSDEVLREAQASLKGQEARLKAALQTVLVMESSITATTQPADGLPLTVKTGGKVVELFAQPGEAVESGQALSRIARFDSLLAHISMPAGENFNTSVSTARIIVNGYEDQPLHGQRIALAAAANPATGGQTLLFAVTAEQLSLQPGMAVTAYLQLPGEPEKGVSVPRSAVIRFTGKAWVYVRAGEEKFTRREIILRRPTPQGWFVTDNLKPQEQVVVRGAQSLLSGELKFQTAGEEEE